MADPEEGSAPLSEGLDPPLAREDKGGREGIPHTHPIPQIIRLELFLESG